MPASSLSVLITNRVLASRTGTELYVRDLALGLLRSGHRPIVFSPKLGPLADELLRETVPVVDDLARIGALPDVIHGHHHPQTMMAMLHFPEVPGIFVCHDWNAWHDAPPLFPRIRRYVAVSSTILDRVSALNGVPLSRVRVIRNAVDLALFQPRKPLPPTPQRALIFTNYKYNVQPIHDACRSAGIALDEGGAAFGQPIQHPERLLGDYDLVFAKGRCALEAIAAGLATIVCDHQGMGGMVTSGGFDRFRALNFGERSMTLPHDAALIAEEIRKYDPADAAAVSHRARATAGLDALLVEMIELYQEVITEQQQAGSDPAAELRAAGDYLRDWGFERRYEWERSRFFRKLPRPLSRALTKLVLDGRGEEWWKR